MTGQKKVRKFESIVLDIGRRPADLQDCALSLRILPDCLKLTLIDKLMDRQTIWFRSMLLQTERPDE